MNWGQPELLPLVWLLLPIGVLVGVATRRKRGRLARIAEPAALERLAPRVIQSRIGLRTAIWLAAIGICLLSLARPQWGERWEEVRRTGLDVIIPPTNVTASISYRKGRRILARHRSQRGSWREMNGTRSRLKPAPRRWG